MSTDEFKKTLNSYGYQLHTGKLFIKKAFISKNKVSKIVVDISKCDFYTIKNMFTCDYNYKKCLLSQNDKYNYISFINSKNNTVEENTIEENIKKAALDDKGTVFNINEIMPNFISLGKPLKISQYEMNFLENFEIMCSFKIMYHFNKNDLETRLAIKSITIPYQEHVHSKFSVNDKLEKIDIQKKGMQVKEWSKKKDIINSIVDIIKNKK